MPRIGGALDIVQVADPATPASGRQFLYFKSDGHLYTKTPAGTVVQVDAAGSTAANVVTSTKTTARKYTVGTNAEMVAAVAGMTDGDIFTVTDVSTIATNDVMTDNEIDVFASKVSFAIPSTLTWTNVTGATLEIPAGVAWDAIIDVCLAISTNATVVSTPMTIDFRLVDALTSTIVYAIMTLRGIFNVASQTQGWIIQGHKCTPRDPLAATTIVKLQARATANANYTFATYTPDADTVAHMWKAARR